MTIKDGRSVPIIYEKVGALTVYSDEKRTRKDLEQLVKKLEPDEFYDQEERALYNMGYVTIPRVLLKSTIFNDLKPAAKILYLWLIVKKQIIKIKKNDGVADYETLHYPAITAKNQEIETYTGIPAKNVSRVVKELLDADLIKTKKEKVGGKITATLYHIPTLKDNKMGYVKVPLKSMITPAWLQLSYSARALWLIMLSEENSEKTRTTEKFPTFTITYSVMQRYGYSRKTISKSLRELEVYEFILTEHGRWNEKAEKRDMNQYKLTAGHLHLWKDDIENIIDELESSY